jgi:N-acetylmuramoyl-L-alanine amidase
MVVKVSEIIVALCDGHGDFGVTAGKRTPKFPAGHKYVGQVMFENAFNKTVVKLLAEHLTRIGFKVLLVAPTDADTPLKTRTDLANNTIKNQFNCRADIYISVHANATTGEWGNAKGIETFIYKTGTEGEKLGKTIHKVLMEGTTFIDRGLKVNPLLWVLKETLMPAVLVECGFMDNIREAELLMFGVYREECALEIAKGICEYYCVPFIPVKEEAPNVVEVIKERVYAANGKLNFVPLNTGKPYSTKATDVRFVSIPSGSIEKVRFVNLKGSTASKIAKANGADLGFNFPFFYNGEILGDSEDQDKVISAAYGKMLKWHELAFVGGKPIIGQIEKSDQQDILIQGAPLLVENGRAVHEAYRKSQEVARRYWPV